MTTNHFRSADYGPAVARLLGEPRLAELGPGSLDTTARAALRAFDPLTDLGGTVVSREFALACHSGLWLYHDGLDESHTISQDLPSAEGSFWHAIMHRREPDAFNSKYWWHRVGPHPVLDQLREQAPALGYGYTTPEAFVDVCERVRGTAGADEEVAKRVQLLEWQILFDWCYLKAIV